MSDVTAEGGPDLPPRRLAWARTSGALVAGIILTTLVLHVVWLVRFRRGYVTEWDESGYLQFALSNFDALHDQGLWTFAKTVAGRETFGPLLPFVTSLAYPIVGRGVFGSLLVLPLFFAGLVGATFALTRRLVSDSWAVVAALAVAAIPAVTDYTRLFHFALPATACMTAALWALVRSDGLRRVGWAAAFGVFVALTLLSRTMTVAYLPGLAARRGNAVPGRGAGGPAQAAQPRNRSRCGLTGCRTLVHPQRAKRLRQSRGLWIRRGRGAVRAPPSDHLVGLLDEGASPRRHATWDFRSPARCSFASFSRWRIWCRATGASSGNLFR